MNKIDINYLSDYWIQRSNIYKLFDSCDENMETINSLMRKYYSCNFLLLKGIYNNNQFCFEFDENEICKNNTAFIRIEWYKNFFSRINKNFHFSFLLNHLYFIPKLKEIENINMIFFGFYLAFFMNI
jgi:hypothetical protein